MTTKIIKYQVSVKKLSVAIALALSPVIANAQFDAVLEVSTLDGNNGFVMKAPSLSLAGISVSGVGDVNGDGIPDLLIGAPFTGDQAGSSYVVFGSSTGFGSSLELTSLNGSNGFVINGIAQGDDSGRSVSSAGDVNGDGIDDLLIGAYNADLNGENSGSNYVVFGNSTGFGSVFELSSIDGSNGFAMNGVAEGDRSGYSISSVGDINDDGIDDLLIGAVEADPNGNNSGASYLVFGRNTGFDSALDLSDLNGSNGFVINGVAEGDKSGRSVSGAGDINGDGIDDLLIGAYNAAPNGTASGSSYVVFGSSTAFASSIELSGLDGSNGFVLNGISENNNFGNAVSDAGDINGDGIDDLLVGAFGLDPFIGGVSVPPGSSYVIFGSTTGFNSVLEMSDLDGSNGFALNGVSLTDRFGWAVNGIGDINSDGLDDLLVGAAGDDSNGTDSGSSYVVFGSSTGFSSVLEMSSLDGSNGFLLNGEAESNVFGSAVSGIGDFNSDGVADFMVSAPIAGGFIAPLAGYNYVIFGRVNDNIFTNGFE